MVGALVRFWLGVPLDAHRQPVAPHDALAVDHAVEAGVALDGQRASST